MHDNDKRPQPDTFEAWIDRKAEEHDRREAEKRMAARWERQRSEKVFEPSPEEVQERKPDRIERHLEDGFAKADAEYRIRYERLHGLFERMFRDPEEGIRRFNAIREARGEERALKILERKPQRISPTKDALRAYFRHSTRERDSASAARLEVRDAYRQTQVAEERQWEARQALQRYRRQRERERDRDREWER